jgi:uncharacterized HAD superfamily protein
VKRSTKGNGKEPIVIVDIDGTIADVKHRLRHIEGKGKKNWKAFFEAMDDDGPIDPVISRVRELSADHEIVMLTGRPSSYGDRTRAWLKRFDVPFDQLLMRGSGDRRQDFVTKEDLLRKLDIERVELAIDDRSPVCDMYERYGIEVWRVGNDEEAAETNEAYRHPPLQGHRK